MGARPTPKAHTLPPARSPRRSFTLAGTGTGNCRRPAQVVDAEQALTGELVMQGSDLLEVNGTPCPAISWT